LLNITLAMLLTFVATVFYLFGFADVCLLLGDRATFLALIPAGLGLMLGFPLSTVHDFTLSLARRQCCTASFMSFPVNDDSFNPNTVQFWYVRLSSLTCGHKMLWFQSMEPQYVSGWKA
jgi:hypothetical protein